MSVIMLALCLVCQTRLESPKYRVVTGPNQRIVHGQVVEKSPTFGKSHGYPARFMTPFITRIPDQTRKPYVPTYSFKVDMDKPYPGLSLNIRQWTGLTPLTNKP